MASLMAVGQERVEQLRQRLHKYLLNKKIKTVQGLPVTRGTETACRADWGRGAPGRPDLVAGPRGRLHTSLESGLSLARSYPTLVPGRDLGTPRPETCSPQEREQGGRLAGGGSPGPAPPKENGPGPCEAPRRPRCPSHKGPGSMAGGGGGGLPLYPSRACLRAGSAIDQACGKIPPPGRPLWPRCQAAPGTGRAPACPAVGTALPDGRRAERAERVGSPGSANRNKGARCRLDCW